MKSVLILSNLLSIQVHLLLHKRDRDCDLVSSRRANHYVDCPQGGDSPRYWTVHLRGESIQKDHISKTWRILRNCHNCMSQISEVFLFVEKNYYQVEADIEDQIAVHHFLQVLGEAIVETNLGGFL